jgi:uncharacterized protein
MMELLEKIMVSLPDGEVNDIRIGLHWTAVVANINGYKRCGLASNPIKNTMLTRDELASLKEGKSAHELCSLATRHDSYLASVGLATVNALLPRQPESWIDINAGEVIAHYGRGKRVALVGHFPFVTELREQVGELNVLELHPREGDLHASEAPQVIPNADVVAITSMAIINGTIEGLLKLCPPQAFVLVLGPSTPLSPVLFDCGIDLLSGSVVEDIEPVLDGIEAGMHFRQLKHLGVRLVTINRQ